MIQARRDIFLVGLTFARRYRFGSYYQMVKMFSEIEATSGNKDKLAKIREYRSGLSDEERQEFNSLMGWYSRKESIRVSSKIVNKFYLNSFVPVSEHRFVESQLGEGGVMKRLCKNDVESELTIYDVNLFLRYLCALSGAGAQKEKVQKIIHFGENVSVMEGIFLLKLIEKRLTIGASNKTFKKASQQPAGSAAEKPKQKKPRSSSKLKAKQDLSLPSEEFKE